MDSLLKEVDEHEGKDPNYFTCKTFEDGPETVLYGINDWFLYPLVEALQANVRDMIWAGGETIGSAMQHYILYMAMNQEVQAKVQAEIDEVIGSERGPSYDDKNR